VQGLQAEVGGTAGDIESLPFLEAARRLGARPERCVVWEDSDLGLEAARRGGMAWIDVRAFHLPARVGDA
jgi:beta-phosphoglucomutase-like phosphatase (HAD superfamily)